MTFEDGCKLSYDIFKKEQNVGIGNITECKDFWLFAKKTEVIEYDSFPIIVYKGDKHSEYLDIELFLKLKPEIDKGVQVPVPEIYTN